MIIKPKVIFIVCILFVTNQVLSKTNKPITKPEILNLFKLEQPKNNFTKNKAPRNNSPKKSAPIIITLDPGHGGKDPGALGQYGAKEKIITLQLAQSLKKTLEATKKFKVFLTRDKDQYLKPWQRRELAIKHKAQVFISIHADSSPKNKQAKGSAIYILSEQGQLSTTKRWQQRYNQNVSKNINKIQLNKQAKDLNQFWLTRESKELNNIWLHWSMQHTTDQSKYIANNLLYSLKKHQFTIHSDRINPGRFIVLGTPKIPSLLLEAGFISNPQMALNLQKASYQDKLARAITQGLLKTF